MMKVASLDINRFKLPLDNRGIIASPSYPYGNYDESTVLFSGGFGLTCLMQ